MGHRIHCARTRATATKQGQQAEPRQRRFKDKDMWKRVVRSMKKSGASDGRHRTSHSIPSRKKGSVSVDTSRQQGAGTYGLGPLLGIGVVLFEGDKELLANGEAGRDSVVERRALDVQPFLTTAQRSIRCAIYQG